MLLADSTFGSTSPPALSTGIQTTFTSPAIVVTTTVSSTIPQCMYVTWAFLAFDITPYSRLKLPQKDKKPCLHINDIQTVHFNFNVKTRMKLRINVSIS